VAGEAFAADRTCGTSANDSDVLHRVVCSPFLVL
jgi:hypothetical protein